MKIAIYSRKSKFTGKGESIDNQIDMCKNYANRQFENIKEFYIYEDEGFSGGDTNRPQFQELMNDAKDKKFDVLICYRLDRVSRDVADFSATIEELNKYNIDFISIKEQFDTTTPMGRAMMYIASVFAQLERETIAERIKDNMLQLATTGRWLGGVPGLGFESEKVTYLDAEYKERSLNVLKANKKEMELVNFIYDKYLELRSIHQVRKYLIQNNYKTKNDAYYSSRVISDILRNPAYVKANNDVVEYLEGEGISVAGKDRINDSKGILIYNKTTDSITNDKDEWIAAIAKHEGVLIPDKWLEVQRQLDKNSIQIGRTGTSKVGLLSGIVRCAKCNSAMNLMYGNKRKDGTAPHYYICNLKTISAKDKCNNNNVSGIDIENTVINKILELAESKETLLEELEGLKKNDNQSSNVNVLDELKEDREKLIEEIDNLVSEVSKSAIASKYILPQIEEKDKEVKNLNEKISKLETEKNKKDKDTENFDLVINNILDFANIIDTLDNVQKKYFIQTIVENVYWDGEKQLVGIKIFTKDIESSKYCSTTSCKGYSNGMVLYANLNTTDKYDDDPEDNLGERIRKQRNIRGLTAREFGELCNLCEGTIYAYESNLAIPSPPTMKRIVKTLDIDIEYFKDDYFNFIFSDNYTDVLKTWRKKNTKNHLQIEEILGISYGSYLHWEKGLVISREFFDKIRDKLNI